MASNLDPRIEEVRVRYGLGKDDFWELPQKRGTWVAKHAALELAAAKAKIEFAPPMVLEADGAAKSAALCVTGTMDGRSEWSVGEASPANNKNAYPFAMAEKRAKDRVILKLIGLQGLLYSEDEADDFKQPNGNGSAPTQRDAIHTPKTMQREPDEDTIRGSQNWVDQEKPNITACERLPDMYQWLDANGESWTKPVTGSPLYRLQNAPAQFEQIKAHYLAKMAELNKKGTK